MLSVDFEVDETMIVDCDPMDRSPVGASVRTVTKVGELACFEQDTGQEDHSHNGNRVKNAGREVLRVTRLDQKENTKGRSKGKEGFSDADLVRKYLEEIVIHPLLTKDDEARLAGIIEVGKAAAERLIDDSQKLKKAEKLALQEAIKKGEVAKTEFINCNLRFVVYLARKIKSDKVPLLDKIQLGNLGLIHAVDMFDARKGFKFSTYASWWIRQSIFRGIAYEGDNITIKLKVRELVGAYNQASGEFAQKYGRFGTPDEVISEHKLDPKTKRALSYIEGTLSLNDLIGEKGDTELGDMVVDELAISPDDQAIEASSRSGIIDLLDILDERERTVMELTCGIDQEHPKTASEIAKILGIKAVAVHPIRNRALSKLRHPLRGTEVGNIDEDSWRQKANCSGFDLDIFFPNRGAETRSAKGICSECKVRSDCLKYAMQSGEKSGIWGGTSERERRKLRSPKK